MLKSLVALIISSRPSTDGAHGKELYFIAAEGKLVAASITGGAKEVTCHVDRVNNCR
jgi:hypothetical protein